MKEFEIAKKASYLAGDILKRYFGKVGYVLKGKGNPLTQADIESEKIIKKIIRENFKDDSIISEESDMIIGNKKRIWLVDPLDGTVNYAHNFPHFAVSIGFVENGYLKTGVIYDCIKDELFVAIRDKGAYLNGKKIKVSKTKNLSQSLLATGFAYDRAERGEFYCSFYSTFLKYSHDIRRCGASSLDMAWVSCGRMDGYWEFNLKPWDVGAGKIIVEEAGGTVVDFSGKKWRNDFEGIINWGKELLATNSKITCQMLEIIKKGLNGE